MKWPRITSTLAFRISGLFLLLLMISGGAFWYWVKSADVTSGMTAEEDAWYSDQAEGQLDTLALDLAPLLGNRQALTDKLVAFGRPVERFGAEVVLFDAQGHPLSASRPDSLTLAVPAVAPTLLQDMSSGVWDYDSYPLPENVDAYENRIFEVDRVFADRDSSGAAVAYLVASYSPTTISQADIQIAEHKIGIHAILLLLIYSGISGLVIMFWTTNRIRRLDAGVEEFSRGNLKARVPGNSKDEIGALGRKFNEMADNIEVMVERLHEKEQFQRQLIANISHDLRTPMASMSGYVETLSLKSDQLSTADRQRYLAIINSNLQHLDKLIDHMLVLSRFDSGQATFNREDFPLGELADSVLLRCEGLAADRNISLDLEVEKTDTLVYADPLQVAQVLQNLVENGIKFNREGGRVTIQLRGAGDRVAIVVQDTGLGIAPEDLPHIFKRFYTASKSRTRDLESPGLAAVHDHLGQSSGLGLAIASKIVSGHGSLLQVESHLEQGTTFSFSLPVARNRVAGRQNA